MKIKNIAILFFGDRTGAGTDAQTKSWKLYLESIGVNCKIYSNTAENVRSNKLNQNSFYSGWTFVDMDDLKSNQDIVDDINTNYDMVLFIDHPAITETVVETIIKKIDPSVLKTQIIMSHSRQALMKKDNWFEVTKIVDMIGTHAKTSEFMKKLETMFITPEHFCSIPASNFKTIKEQFWKPLDTKVKSTVGWIGRLQALKGPELFIDIHDKYLKDRGYITTLSGCEFSNPGVVPYGYVDGNRYKRDENNENILDENGDKIPNPRHDTLDCTVAAARRKYDPVKWMEVPTGEPAILFPKYNRDEGLHRLSDYMFGGNGYRLKPHQYGYSLENAHIEILSIGVVPVFARRCGINLINYVTQKPHYDIDKTLYENLMITGTVWIDEENYEEVADLMDKLNSDMELYETVRNLAFDYWTDCYDDTLVYSDTMDLWNKAFEQKKNGQKINIDGINNLTNDTVSLIKTKKISGTSSLF